MNIFSFSAILVWAAAVIGWIMNIYKFVSMFGEEVSTWFIARAIGIFFAPFGAVIGYL